MTEKAALKPCPFCGGRALLIVWADGRDPLVRIECMDCKCSTPGIVFRPDHQRTTPVYDAGWQPDLSAARGLAFDAWNRRQGDDRTKAPAPA